MGRDLLTSLVTFPKRMHWVGGSGGAAQSVEARHQTKQKHRLLRDATTKHQLRNHQHLESRNDSFHEDAPFHFKSRQNWRTYLSERRASTSVVFRSHRTTPRRSGDKSINMATINFDINDALKHYMSDPSQIPTPEVDGALLDCENDPEALTNPVINPVLNSIVDAVADNPDAMMRAANVDSLQFLLKYVPCRNELRTNFAPMPW